MKNEEPVLILQKNADKTMNKVTIPKVYIEKYGRRFCMKIYDDGMIIMKPLKE